MDDSWFRVVGTSHIAREAERLIRAAAKAFAPDVVAVELDAGRLQALLAEERPDYSPRLVAQVGVRGYLFALLGAWVQRKLGARVNVLPGSDMLAAFRLAQRESRQALLIDQDVRLTLRKLNGALGWRELRQFLRDGWNGLRGKERLAFDLRRVPSSALVSRLLTEFRTRYPRPYRVLVHERNVHMARALRRFHTLFPDKRVLVVVGAGHVEGLVELLESP